MATVLSNMMTALCDYGTLQAGQSYKILGVSLDNVQVSFGGKVLYTPRHVFYEEGEVPSRDAALLRRVSRFAARPPETLAADRKPSRSPFLS